MQKTVAPSELKPADVLLCRGDSDISLGIVELDGGSYSHAALWSGECVIESTLPCVKRSSVEECASHSLYIDAYRYQGLDQRSRAVVANAEAYLDRPYGTLNLGLSTLLVAVTSWMPHEWAEMNALYGAGELARLLRLLRLVKDECRDERQVTCAELVVRCYHDADVPLTVKLKGERKFHGSSFLGAIREVSLRVSETRPRGLGFEDPVRAIDEELSWLGRFEPGSPLAGQGSDAWLETRAEWYHSLQLELPGSQANEAPLDPMALSPELIRAKELVAGRDWAAGLVTPHQLESSPSLVLVGRVAERAS